MAKGVNSLILNSVEHYYNGPADASGYLPWNNMSTPFIDPCEGYWKNVDFTINYCASNNIVVFLTPAYLGYDDGADRPEGWYADVSNATASTMKKYGEFLGYRYRNNKNIIWVSGGDGCDGHTVDKYNQIIAGIEASSGKSELFTAHDQRYFASDVNYNEPWLDSHTVYSGGSYIARDCSDMMYKGYNYVFFEGGYSGHNTYFSNEGKILRTQMYTPVLMGGAGTFYGDLSIFAFEAPYGQYWVQAMNDSGSYDLQRYGQLFKSRAWYNLVPDISGVILTRGSGAVDTSSYVSCSVTKDGNTVICYLPSQKDISINLTKISGTSVHSWWYNPATGATTDLGTQTNDKTVNYRPSSSGDWVLIIDNNALGYGAPGTGTITVSSVPSLTDNDGKDYVVKVAPTVSGAISHWSLDESTGTRFTDDIGGQHALKNKPILHAPGKLGVGCQFFDWTNLECASVGNSAIYNFDKDASFSITFWFKFEDTQYGLSGGQDHIIISKGEWNGGGSLADGMWASGVNGSGKLNFLLRDNTGDKIDAEGPGSYNDGRWHFATLIRNGIDDTNKIYCDNVLIDTQTHNYAGNFNTTMPIKFASLTNSGTAQYFYHGYIDDITIFGRALTTTDIAILMG